MNKLHLIFRLVKQLKTKAILLMLITTIAEFAVIYIVGLYRLPKTYSRKLDAISDCGDYIFFDTLGRKEDIASAFENNGSILDILYVSYICGLREDGRTYYLKAVSSVKCFNDNKCTPFAETLNEPQIVVPKSAFGNNKRGDYVEADLLYGSKKETVGFRICGKISDTIPILNFHFGSNNVSAYEMFAPCEDDIYVYQGDILSSTLYEKFGLTPDVTYPNNGIIIFKKNSSQEERTAAEEQLLNMDISVQHMSEIENRTEKISRETINSYSGLPLFIMALSLISSAAILVFSIDTEAKNISVIELVGCSEMEGTGIMTCVFASVLLPGLCVNGLAVAAISEGLIRLNNVLILYDSLLYLALTFIFFVIISGVISAALMNNRSYVIRKLEET